MDTRQNSSQHNVMRRFFHTHPIRASHSPRRTTRQVEEPSESSTEIPRSNVSNLLPARTPRTARRLPQSNSAEGLRCKESIGNTSSQNWYEVRATRNTLAKTQRNRSLINSLRAGVCSAPSLYNRTNRARNSGSRSCKPTRITSISVSSLSLPRKLKDGDMNSQPLSINPSLETSESSVPDINSNTEFGVVDGGIKPVWMFGKWGCRSSQTKREIVNCWTDGCEQNLTVSVRSLMLPQTDRSLTQNEFMRKASKVSAKKAAIQKRNCRKEQKVLVAPATSPELRREPLEDKRTEDEKMVDEKMVDEKTVDGKTVDEEDVLAQKGPTSTPIEEENPKVGLKIIIDAPIENNSEEEAQQIESGLTSHDKRCLSPVQGLDNTLYTIKPIIKSSSWNRRTSITLHDIQEDEDDEVHERGGGGEHENEADDNEADDTDNEADCHENEDDDFISIQASSLDLEDEDFRDLIIMTDEVTYL